MTGPSLDLDALRDGLERIASVVPDWYALTCMDAIRALEEQRDRISTLEEALRRVGYYCGEELERGARGDWDGLLAVVTDALVGSPAENKEPA